MVAQELTLSASDTGTRNHRRLCAVHYSKTPGFEVQYCTEEYVRMGVWGYVHMGVCAYGCIF